MKYTHTDLEKLADHLDAQAGVAAAKAKELEGHLLQMDDRDKQLARASSGRKYAAVCRYFAERERVRVGRPLNQPTLEDVVEYAAEDTEMRTWPRGDIHKWFDHFESNGWKVAGKTPMKSWQAAARNGFRRWKEQHPTKSTSKDPDGWIEFLQSAGVPYKEYRYSPQHVQSDFRKTKK